MERDVDLAYFVALAEVDGLGPVRLPLLLKYFGSARKTWEASEEQLKDLGMPKDVLKQFVRRKSETHPEIHLKQLAQMGVHVVTALDEEYPPLLKQISDRPSVLYVKGKILPEDQKAIAVVGTRKPTPYGREVTERLVSELSRYQVTIVSGLARGIDSVAHRAALNEGGRTIAVMATGIDQIYPPENRELAELILQRGALVSEFCPGYVAVPGNFPARNRIISGMSLGVVVTEGAAKSGTKITADHALNQGREVFAVPGPITSPMSEGPVELLKMGAKAVTGAEDILSEILNSKFETRNNIQIQNSKLKTPIFENELEEKIYHLLENGQMQVDDLVRSAKSSSAEVGAALTMLEVRGLVKHLGGMVYCRV